MRPVSGGQVAFASCMTDTKRHQWGALLASTCSLTWGRVRGFSTFMTLNRCRICMSLRLFVVPLLGPSLPDFGFSADTTNEWFIDVKLWQSAVRVDMQQFRTIGREGSGVSSLLFRVQ